MKIKLKLLFLLILTLSISACDDSDEPCIAWDNLPVKIHAITDIEKQTIDEVNEVFGEDVLLDDPDGIEVRIVNTIPRSGRTKTYCDAEGTITSGEIQIKEEFYDQPDSRNLLAHEYLHLLGFSHHTEHGIMQPNVDLNYSKPFGLVNMDTTLKCRRL